MFSLKKMLVFLFAFNVILQCRLEAVIYVKNFQLDCCLKKYKNENLKEFALLTLPKSGSHISLKLLEILTGKKVVLRKWHTFGSAEFEKEIINLRNSYLWGHICDNEFARVNEYYNVNPSFLRIVQIRDLRDLFVSFVNYFDQQPERWLKREISPNATFSEKLICLMKSNHRVNCSPLSVHLDNSLKLCSDSNVFVIRFEEIIGPSGGGDLEIQLALVSNLCQALEIELTDEKINYILNHLYGTNSGPKQPGDYFYNGKIGSWKFYFNDDHKRIFNELWGYYQISLGYPLAE